MRITPVRTLYTNGSLFDGHRHLGPGELLVESGPLGGGVIVAVAPRGTLDAAGTTVVDMAGGLLVPGFTDAHVHPIQGGLERLRCDLSATTDRAGYLRAIKAYADANAEVPWILGGGWAMAAFPGGTPTAAELDAIVPDRPAFLPNRDHHSAWVNSRALQMAAITASTPDPPHGRVERDVDGRPSGTLHEDAMAMVSRLIPATTGPEYDDALLEGQRYLHSVGVTSWQDAIVGAYAGIDDPALTYVRAAERGDLISHVVGALWWDRNLGQEQVSALVARRSRLRRPRFQPTSVKIMQDGVAENFTAAMTSPYLDRSGRPTTNAGHSFVEPSALRSAVAALDAAGFQVHVHAIGDRAARQALDAFEGTDRANRHHIAHLQVVHPQDIPRFAALGIGANLQMLWACYDEQMVDLTLPFLGPERSSWQYPFANLHRAGARLAAGSDWPVSTPDPLAAIHVAVNRTEHGGRGRAGSEPFLPHQAIPLDVAFAAYTSGSAWLNHRDDAGVLRPGAVADLVVLDRDPFAGPLDEVGATTVRSTWIDGVAVYPSGGHV
jgi:predicted amidohydrolase YtcJ